MKEDYSRILNEQGSQLKNKLAELWRQNSVRGTLFLHSLYIFLGLVITLFFLRDQNDFIVFMKAGEIFLTKPNELYNQEYYLWDFRYFPVVAILFIPFYLLGFDWGFIIFNLMSLILNVLICILIYKLILLVRNPDQETDTKRPLLYSCFYLMGVPHVFNYVLGQFNIPFIFVILLSLYLFLKKKGLKWEFVAGLLIGISIILKPIALTLVPFILIIHLDLKRKKLNINYSKSIVRLMGVIVPNLFNILLFILYPQMFNGFMETNFTGSTPIRINFSFSVTKLILNFCYIADIPFNQLTILFVVGVIFAGIAFFTYIIGDENEYKIIYGFTFGILIQLLVFYDSWDHHLLNLTPLLILIIFNLPRHSKLAAPYFKKGFFFLNFFDLLFMSFWFLTAPYFPFNYYSTVFLIIIFIGTCKCSMSLNSVLNLREKEGIK